MKLVAIDTETTGLDPKTSQVLQLGACIFDTESEQFSTIDYNKFIYHKMIHGSPVAIAMNAHIIAKFDPWINTVKRLDKLNSVILAKCGECCDDERNQAEFFAQSVKHGVLAENVTSDFDTWLISNGGYYKDAYDKQHLNLCAKNLFSFDLPMLETLPMWKKTIHCHRRTIDPGALYAESTDLVPPALNVCKARAIEKIQSFITQNESLSDEMKQHLGSLFENDTVTHDALDDAKDVAKLIWLHFYFKKVQCR